MCPLYCKHPKVFRRDNKLLLVERPQHYSIFLPHSLHMLQKQYVINAMTRFVATVYSHKPWRCMKGSISEWHSNRQGDSLQYGRRTKSGNSTRTYQTQSAEIHKEKRHGSQLQEIKYPTHINKKETRQYSYYVWLAHIECFPSTWFCGEDFNILPNCTFTIKSVKFLISPLTDEKTEKSMIKSLPPGHSKKTPKIQNSNGISTPTEND